MYDILFVFLSTAFLTAYITRWFYTTKEPKQERALKVTEWTKTPSNIPTISQEKHDEFIQLMSQWKAKTA